MSTGEASELMDHLREMLTRARQAGLDQEIRGLLREFTAAEVKDSGSSADSSADSMGAGGNPEARRFRKRFGMIGESAPMQALYTTIERVAPSDVPVLVQGETGTGKELVARGLHDGSKRAKHAFVAENCAAVAPTLLESELFGHKRGAFTGAVADRDGCFVTADAGTIFLDEIGDMPIAMQAKLLRVLEQGEVRPVGSSRVLKVDVRIVAATNKDLEQMVGEGAFRQDLFYRLNVVSILLPPLRERLGDVRLLVQYLVSQHAKSREGELPVVSEEALCELESRPWPGNVRQLENEIRRALALSGGKIGIADLSPATS